MTKTQFGNIINSLKKLFPEDRRDKSVFEQEYYNSLKSYEMETVVKAINSLSARLLPNQKYIWTIETIESEVRKFCAQKYYPAVKWRKSINDTWKYTTCELNKAKDLEKRFPMLFEIEYGSLPAEIQNNENEFTNPDEIGEKLKEIYKLFEENNEEIPF